LADTRLTVAYGIWRWLGAEVQIPFRVSHTSIEFRRLDGTPFSPDYLSIHHRDETLAGLADPWLLARADVELAGTALGARLGASLPVGRTEPNPFALGAMGQAHQHVQFGAGTVAPVAIVSAVRPLGARWSASAYGQAQL